MWDILTKIFTVVSESAIDVTNWKLIECCFNGNRQTGICKRKALQNCPNVNFWRNGRIINSADWQNSKDKVSLKVSIHKIMCEYSDGISDNSTQYSHSIHHYQPKKTLITLSIILQPVLMIHLKIGITLKVDLIFYQ